ncbi:hypothetical protein HMSSN036_63230 [Paenibacillus macerans]|nr:hypothetical protein HMSSN036_63230 [Paenibacillus macerans]
MTFVRTLDADIAPEQMGFTYSHEHIVCRPAHWSERGEDDLLLDDPENPNSMCSILKNTAARRSSTRRRSITAGMCRRSTIL